MKKTGDKIYYLSKKKVILLFIYYSVILLFGVIASVYFGIKVSVEKQAETLLKYCFYISLTISVVFCSVRYSQYLYNACINEKISHVKDNSLKEIGNFMYFILRPVFAMVFSIAMVFGMLSGMFVVAGNLDYVLNDKFVYLCATFSSMLGYSIGRFIDKFRVLSIIKTNDMK